MSAYDLLCFDLGVAPMGMVHQYVGRVFLSCAQRSKETGDPCHAIVTGDTQRLEIFLGYTLDMARSLDISPVPGKNMGLVAIGSSLYVPEDMLTRLLIERGYMPTTKTVHIRHGEIKLDELPAAAEA